MPWDTTIAISFYNINPFFCHTKPPPKRIEEVASKKTIPSFTDNT
jgi:hypothetical protein